MSKSIRYLTDLGFQKLVKDIKSKYSFLQVTKQYPRKEYLGNDSVDMVFINYDEKSITPIILSYRIFYEKNVRTKCLGTEGFEKALTRKTLIRKLNNLKKLLEEYETV